MLRRDERPPLGPGALAQAHPRRDRGFAAPPRHRLRRPLPAPPSRSVDADGREPAGARRHRARRQGRYVGCSNYFAYQIARALGRSEHLGLARFDSVQPRYNLLFRQVERELFPLCAEEGLGVIPYNPIAGGLLSGKHRREAGPMAGTRFTHPTAGARYRERYWHDRELETVETLGPLAAEAGMSMAQMAVAWVLENPVVTSAIVGASRPEQLDDALAAVDKGLDESLKARLDELTREYRWGDDIR